MLESEHARAGAHGFRNGQHGAMCGRNRSLEALGSSEIGIVGTPRRTLVWVAGYSEQGQRQGGPLGRGGS